MGTMTRAETAAYLKERDGFAILTHRRPDGDTLGSSALLCRGLRSLGKKAHILDNPEITEKYAYLHQGLTKPWVEDGDVVICVDVAAKGMLLEEYRPLRGHIDLRIDHHGTAESFTTHELVEPGTAACGEIVYGVLTEMGAALDEPMAMALYTAISTDTGCFRYANTTAQTFQTAAACAQVSDQLFLLNQTLFETNSLGRLRLQGWIIKNTLFLQDGAVAICALPKSVEEELNLTEDDLENISGFPRSIEGVKIAATLREDPGRVKVSVRAVPGYDAAAVCAKFGGGGHKGAAGASIPGTLEEVTKAVADAVLEIMAATGVIA